MERETKANNHEDNPRDIRAISFLPNGDVLKGNVPETDNLEIMSKY